MAKKSAQPKTAKPKTARPLGSGSKILEASHSEFVSRVIREDLRTLRISETPDAWFITIVDIERLRADKKTGLISTERWTSSPDGSSWKKQSSQLVSHFWSTNAELLSVFTQGWRLRLHEVIPSQEVCYPGSPLNKQGWREVMISRAADRRLGGRKNKSILLRMFTKALWNQLVDRETLRLCHAFFGRKASLDDYNFTVRRKKELQARALETPNLTRIIGAYIKITPGLRLGRTRLPQDILAKAREELFKASRMPANPWFARNGATVFPPENISPAGWRYLATLTGTSVDRLWSVARWDTRIDEYGGESVGAKLATVVNLLAKTGERPPLFFARWALENISWSAPGYSPADVAHVQDCALRVIRLAAQQAILAKKRGRLKQFLRGDLLLVWDWFRKQGHDGPIRGFDEDNPPPTLLTVSKNATWASLMRSQQEWHAQLAERERIRREANQRTQEAWLAKQDAITWSSALGECQVNGATARPLTTGKALRDEGSEMQHCVGSYVTYCQNGKSRIFALERDGERATLELVTTDSRSWRVRQVFGRQNTPVSKAVTKAAAELAKLYQVACKQLEGKAA